jgi:hypothetical protein
MEPGMKNSTYSLGRDGVGAGWFPILLSVIELAPFCPCSRFSTMNVFPGRFQGGTTRFGRPSAGRLKCDVTEREYVTEEGYVIEAGDGTQGPIHDPQKDSAGNGKPHFGLSRASWRVAEWWGRLDRARAKNEYGSQKETAGFCPAVSVVRFERVDYQVSTVEAKRV